MRHILSMLPVALLSVLVPTLQAQTPLPIPNVRTMQIIPSAKELPDPALKYKIAFDLTAEPGHENEANENLEFIAGIVNTFAKYGVDQTHRKFVVVLHGGTVMLAANEETYRRLNKGQSNPNRTIMAELEAAGVQMVACGQSALSKGIQPEMIDPSIQLNLSATITFMNLQTRGYVRIPA